MTTNACKDLNLIMMKLIRVMNYRIEYLILILSFGVILISSENEDECI